MEKKYEKKIVSLVLAVVLLFCAAASLVSCDLSAVGSGTAVSIKKTEINESGELIIYYTDGKKENLGCIVGKDGDDGDAVKVVEATINDDGELILTYSDGTEDNLGVVVGKDGDDGKDADTPPIYNNNEVQIEISGDAESAVAALTAAAPSVVSVYCNYTVGLSTTASAGSGVIYSIDKATGDALIITNYHLVYDDTTHRLADAIGINIYGSPLQSQMIPATIVGGSISEDIAVLQVKGSERLKNSSAKSAVIASSDALYPGDTAIAIGNPKGKGISATYGKVNVVSESLQTTDANKAQTTLRVIRIDTAINGGNSGGGLFDNQGRLIGIVNAKSIDENIENIGYSLPIDKVVPLVQNILYYCLEDEYITPYKPTFGISVQIVDSVGELNGVTGGIDIKETVMVTGITEDTVSDGMLQVNDKVLSVKVGSKTITVTRMYHLAEAALLLRPGDSITFLVLRDGVETEITLTPEASAYAPC